MQLRLTDIPKQWNGDPVGIDDRPGQNNRPRNLRSFLLQALSEAQLGELIQGGGGRRQTEPPDVLLKRSRLCARLESSDLGIELDTDEFALCETCVAALWMEGVSVKVLGALHAAVGKEEASDEQEAEEAKAG
jgi:hypothetical protein